MLTITTLHGSHSRPPQAPDDTPIVFIVDPDRSTRESLALVVEASGWRAETFASGEKFLARPSASVANCLAVDITMPDVSGLALQKRLAVDRPGTPIIFLSEHRDLRATVAAMKAGAVEFLTKPISEELLVEAIRHALDRSQLALEQEAEMISLRQRYASLSRREREVMLLVVSGLLNKQVGGELGISEITVKAHRGQAMRKMKADSLPALVHMVSRLGVPTALSAGTAARTDVVSRTPYLLDRGPSSLGGEVATRRASY